jgi:hypothetical protein
MSSLVQDALVITDEKLDLLSGRNVLTPPDTPSPLTSAIEISDVPSDIESCNVSEDGDPNIDDSDTESVEDVEPHDQFCEEKNIMNEGLIADVVNSILEPLSQTEEELRNSLPFNDGLLLTMNVALALLMFVWLGLLVVVWNHQMFFTVLASLGLTAAMSVTINWFALQLKLNLDIQAEKTE